MKIVRLTEDAIIHGVLRSKGELVSVPDGWNDAQHKVIKYKVEAKNKAAFENAKKKVKPDKEKPKGKDDKAK